MFVVGGGSHFERGSVLILGNSFKLVTVRFVGKDSRVDGTGSAQQNLVEFSGFSFFYIYSSDIDI